MLRTIAAGLCVLGLTTCGGCAPSELIEEPISPHDRQHWAFQPIRPYTPPPTADATHLSYVDSLVGRALAKQGWTLAPQADRGTLMRRATFDTTGLLPTLQEQREFLQDPRPDAYERLVDRLLASPHFGERMAQQWLDVVRFAESNGFEFDGDRPSAWRYRDYVVRAFNEDRPWDRFIREQLAGDELAAGKSPAEAAELWVATGLHRCGPFHMVGGNVDAELTQQEFRTEMLQSVGTAFLGLTLTCARCHDHKFDPISQADYYRLEAYFAGVRPREVDFSSPGEKARMMKEILDLQLQIRPLKSRVAEIDRPYEARLREAKIASLEPETRAAFATPADQRTPDQKKRVSQAGVLVKVTWDEVVAALSPEDRRLREEFREQQYALEAQLPPPASQAWAVAEEREVPPTHVLKRGEIKKKGAVVQRAVPRVLNARELRVQSRRELADWLCQPDHPLTSRVIVNRIWQNYFGVGLVATAGDFGLHGTPPTHPELLDALASQMMQNGWRAKAIHRQILLSSAYRQRSDVSPTPQQQQHDPDNRLLWRMNRKRMEGESLRDNMLHASGSLNLQVGGPSVRVPLEKEVYDLIFTEGEPGGLWPVTPDASQHRRRSLYLFAKRNVRLPILEAFDQPDRISPCTGRTRSTFAPQALVLLNGPASLDAARRLASRLLSESPQDWAALVRAGFAICLGREPTPDECVRLDRFRTEQEALISERLTQGLPVNNLESMPRGADPVRVALVIDLALVLFNLNEFAYIA